MTRNRLLSKLLYSGGLLTLGLIAGLFASGYWIHVLNISLIYAIVAIGLNISLGLGGQISFGHAAFFAIGAYTVGLLTVDAHWSYWPAFGAALLLSAVVGAIVGIPSLRIRGHYLALVTLGLGEVVRLVLLNWTNVTHGVNGVRNIPGIPLAGGVLKTEGSYYWFLLVAAVLVLLFSAFFADSWLGRALRAIHFNDLFAEVIGVPTARVKITAFVLSAVIAGLAGAIYAPWFAYIHPELGLAHFTLMIIICLVVGGVGSVPGPVLGAVVLTVLQEWLRFMGQYYILVTAVLTIILILFAPEGLWGLTTLGARLILRRWRPREVTIDERTAS